MAANTNPVFPDSGVNSGVAVAQVTNVAAGTSAATLFTAGSDGALWSAVKFTPTAQINGGGLLLIYVNNGSADILYDAIQIPDPWNFSASQPPQTLIWTVPTGRQFVLASATVKVGQIAQTGTIHAQAVVANF